MLKKKNTKKTTMLLQSLSLVVESYVFLMWLVCLVYTLLYKIYFKNDDRTLLTLQLFHILWIAEIGERV